MTRTEIDAFESRIETLSDAELFAEVLMTKDRDKLALLTGEMERRNLQRGDEARPATRDGNKLPLWWWIAVVFFVSAIVVNLIRGGNW